MSERIVQGDVVIFNGPRSIVNNSIENNDNGPTLFRVNPRIFHALVQEYRSIHRLVSSLIPPHQLIIDNSPFADVDCASDLERMLPNDLKALPLTNLPFGENIPTYLRDAHTYINGLFIPNEQTWRFAKYDDESALGEGGAVLTRKDLIIPSTEVLYHAEEYAENLEHQGFRFGTLMPRHNTATEIFAEHHIDGHAALVEDRNGNLHLLTAKHYYDQDEHTGFAVDQTVALNRLEHHHIDTTGLPPMALNFHQFDDTTIAMTSGATELEDLLKELVGKQNVHTTDCPIISIPKETHAGIRCIMNIMPRKLLLY